MAKGNMAADVVLRFSPGREMRLGRIEFTMQPEDQELVDKPMRFFNQRFGWALVREGFRIMRKGQEHEAGKEDANNG